MRVAKSVDEHELSIQSGAYYAIELLNANRGGEASEL